MGILVMVEHVRVFMDPDMRTELDDIYIGREQELRKEVQTYVKNLFVDTKVNQMNKTIVCRVEREGDDIERTRLVREEPIPFKEIDFTKIKVRHDPKWRPDVEEPEKMAYYELAVGDATWKKLQECATHFLVRIFKFNESILTPSQAEEYKKTGTKPSGLTKLQEKKWIEENICFENIMQVYLYTPIANLIIKQAGKPCEDEFAELEKKESEKPSS